MANMGIIPAGMYRNKEYISRDVNIIDVDTTLSEISFETRFSFIAVFNIPTPIGFVFYSNDR